MKPNSSTYHRVPYTEVWTITHLRGIFPNRLPPPSLNDAAVLETAPLERWLWEEGAQWPGGRTALTGASQQESRQQGRGPARRLPWGLWLGLQGNQSQGEQIKACSLGRKHLKCFICGNASTFPPGSRLKSSPKRKARTPPGSPDTEARGLASRTVENIPERLSCLEVLGVLLIACSYHLLFKVFHPHSFFATHCSPIALAKKGRSLLVEKKVKVFSLFNTQTILDLTDLPIARMFFLFIIICSCTDFSNISVKSKLHLCNPISCKNSLLAAFLAN